MRRWMAVALVVVGIAGQACAQRGGSRGGFSGHSSAGFHGGFAPGGRVSFAGPVRVGGSRVGGVAPMRSYGYGGRPGYGGYRGRGGARYYGVAIPFVAPYGTAWIGPDALDYGDSGYYGDAGMPPPEPQNYVEQAGPPPVDAGSVSGPYEANAGPRTNAAPPEPEEAVTVVFKDGRPPETIHNYMLSRTTLYVRDARKQDIPVADIDLAATEKVNQGAGVEFQLPGAAR